MERIVHKRGTWILAILIVSLTASVTLAGRPGAAVPLQGRFDLPADPDQIVVKFTERIGEVRSEDMPSVTVYADGRVVRHRADFMSDPGDYVSTIAASELNALVASLDVKGMMRFDAARARRDVKAAERRRKTVFAASDESRFSFEIHLDAYQRPGNLIRDKRVHASAAWTGLRADARRFPEIESIQGFAAACRELDALAARVERDAGLAER